MVGTNLGMKNCTSMLVASFSVSNDFVGTLFLRGIFLVISWITIMKYATKVTFFSKLIFCYILEYSISITLNLEQYSSIIKPFYLIYHVRAEDGR